MYIFFIYIKNKYLFIVICFSFNSEITSLNTYERIEKREK
jgi:hypothetical protein